MTRSEQEALSRQHYAYYILHLSTGEYAVWTFKRKLVGITTSPLDFDLTFKPPEAPEAPKPRDLLDELKELGL
jgi:hypothetical protein